jgi:DNA-binding beta-propeller fold protein YncE
MMDRTMTMRLVSHAAWGAIGLLLLLSGCARPAGVIFPPPARPILWPAPPERARVRYVGQLITEADLKPAVPFGQGFGEAIFGKKSIRSMLTPYAVCTDQKDRLFVADSNAQLVHVFDLQTRKYEQWKPPASAPPFSQPVGIAWDPAGVLFVADSVGGRIVTFDSTGKFLGEFARGLVTRPCGLAFDVKNRRLLVADAETHQLVFLTMDGALQQRIGSRGVGLGRFNFPTNVAIDSQGRIYVADSLNFRVQQFSPDLQTIKQIGRKGDMPGYFGQPKGLAIDSQDHLFVVDAGFETIQVFDSTGEILLNFGQEGTNPGEFWLPTGIFIDVHNRIWIADSYNRRVQVFDYLPEEGP